LKFEFQIVCFNIIFCALFLQVQQLETDELSLKLPLASCNIP